MCLVQFCIGHTYEQAFFCSLFHIIYSFKQGTPALPQSSIAADLLKGTITKLATEDLSSPDKARGEQLAKGHVIYEGKSGHILSYDGKCHDHQYMNDLYLFSPSAQTET